MADDDSLTTLEEGGRTVLAALPASAILAPGIAACIALTCPLLAPVLRPLIIAITPQAIKESGVCVTEAIAIAANQR